MSILREQLHAARAAYREAHYPGDLADFLPPVAPASSRWTLRQAGTGMGLAAAAAVVILLGGFVTQSAGNGSQANRWQALMPTYRDLPQLPKRDEMAGAMRKVTPPEAADLLMDVRQPLESSGEFIVNIGKDLAHHADALFHMG